MPNIISELLRINAIKLNLEKPYTWASGWKSPLYCDNRKTLSYPNVRKQISEGFKNVINSNFSEVNVVAGVATGAIAQGVLVADALQLPFIYVRSAAKKHGLENLVEGHLEPNQNVVVVEDLVSTGLSSLKAVEAIRNAGANVLGMVAIFSYGFDLAAKNFEDHKVPLYTLANYNQLISHVLETGLLNEQQLEALSNWRKNPDKWGL